MNPGSAIEPTRRFVRNLGLPYVIENVAGAPLVDPVRLCGQAFGLGCERGPLRRHRYFESDVALVGTPCRHRRGDPRPVGVYGTLDDDIPHGGRTARTLAEGQELMGIDWLPWSRLREAVPPAYTEHVGRQLLAAL